MNMMSSLQPWWLIGLLWAVHVYLPAAEGPAGEVMRLTGPVAKVDVTVGLGGLTMTATEPLELRGTIHCQTNDSSGLMASVFATSLRGVTEDDWRKTQPIAGTRQDACIAFTSSAFGTPAERAACGIGGTDSDWNNFSMQWDGWLQVMADDTELATTSDDGTRLWLDRNNNGQLEPSEWGSNGWGNGQGITQRSVQQHVARGYYRIRLQFEDGNGGNACSLLWGVRGGGFTAIPVQGFHVLTTLDLRGPLTLAAQITGLGEVRLGAGVHVAEAPVTADLLVTGLVTLAPRVNRLDNSLRIASTGVLDLGSGSLACSRLDGAGIVRLAGGTLTMPPGRTELRLEGTGAITIAGSAECGDFSPRLQVEQGTLRSAQRYHGRVALLSPLTTMLTLAHAATGPQRLQITVEVPADAPQDLGLGCWRADVQGRWFQRLAPGPLAPGRHTYDFDLGEADLLAPESHAGRWTADAGADAGELGIFFFSTESSHASIRVNAQWSTGVGAVRDPAGPRLADVHLPTSAHTGQRWELSVRPDPYPTNPCDADSFRLDLEVTAPDGSTTTYGGFHDEPMTAVDRGDRETCTTAGAPRFKVRFRPRVAGRHTMRLTAHWHGGGTAAVSLPALEATGTPWDDIVRVDAKDPRFFSAGGRFVWPAGCNLHSTYDVRSRSGLQTKLTPDRGSFTRMDFLERLAAEGGNGCEIWLSPWNLGLEWIPRWPGFRGPGRYHQGHAWALDQFLDRAEALGVRVNVSIFNHGMARDGGGAEDDWRFHPYGVNQGGWLAGPAGLFEDERAFSAQKSLFRYLVARYGDSPALLGWKLWAEVNLAQAPIASVRSWHGRASAALKAIDPWQHPITTHWCGDWTGVDREIASLASIDYLTIDAYKNDNTLVADALCKSTRDPLHRNLGLAWAKKPVLVTEFGGDSGGTNRTLMGPEHALGPWAGMVAGHAGAPMLWWFEWIDQEDRFAVYGAINRFLVGEDLRDPQAQTIAPPATAPWATLWCRAWSRPGRMLGYVVDRTWGMGGASRPIAEALLLIGNDVRAGALRLEWWDADIGTVISTQHLTHPGGRLELRPPQFSRHLAYKLIRP